MGDTNILKVPHKLSLSWGELIECMLLPCPRQQPGEVSAFQLCSTACSARHFLRVGSAARTRWKAFGQNADLINAHVYPSAVCQERTARRQVTRQSPPGSLCLWASTCRHKAVCVCELCPGCATRSKSRGLADLRTRKSGSWPTRRQ